MKKQLKIAIFIAIVITILAIITFIPHGLLDIVKNTILKEEVYSFNYELKKYDINTNEYYILITVTNPEGIEQIEYPDEENILDCNGRKKIAIDYTTKDMTDYKFTITLSNGEKKEEIIQFERQRTGKGTYKKVKGVYLHTPNVEDGLEKENTRYLKIEGNGVLQPANWITDEEPENWYDYKNKKWANIYVENKGIESYYVWIPRYAYKKDENSETGNERVDIKFIDVYNNYIDPETDEKIAWEVLHNEGYEIPEAFEFGNFNEISISGYWMSKYELSNLGEYTIDYSLTASMKEFNVNNVRVSETKKEKIAKYTYALNGQIQHESTTIENYSFKNARPSMEDTINVTALDAQGRIVGSMTKKLELAEVNPPNLEGFDKETTFYVYWDEDGNEHNEIPISQAPPKEWYNYTYGNWANIVTRNNDLESYFVWIPRYQYSLDTTSQRTDIRFIQGITVNTEAGYQIPEAFTTEIDTEQGKMEIELEGYWISKYELSSETANLKVNTELTAVDNIIMVKDITGTAIDNAKIVKEITKSDGTIETIETPIALKYEYYLDGNKKHEGTTNTENYIYTGLEPNSTHVVTIIIREKQSNKFLGATTKRVTIKRVNEPQFDGFIEDRTYYVTYDKSGNMKVGDKIKKDRSNMPKDWYSYGESKWANIVVTDGKVRNGKIEDATTTSYFVWIPRYQYKLDTTKQRVDIDFIEGNGTEATLGYQIPEAFTWETVIGGKTETKELMGYWISKYELSN